MKVLTFIVVMFLAVNVGVLYYIVLFGDVPEFAQRLDVQERRVDSLIQRETKAVGDNLEVQTSEGLVVLSDQQKNELIDGLKTQIAPDIKTIIDYNLAEKEAEEVVSQTEYFIPIGGASVKTSDNNWKNLPVEVEFDRSRYGKVVQVTWEATLNVPTGNGQVQARLVDATAGVVAGSEMTGEGSDGVYVKSGNLSIAAGRRTLKLQMRTSLDFDGVVSNAKLRIMTE